MAEVIKTIVDVEINTGPASAQLKALQQQLNSFNLALNKNNTFQTNATQKYTKELTDVVNSSKFFTAETMRMRTAAGALDSTLRRGSATLGQFFTAKFNRNSALFAETMSLASERARVMQTQFVAAGGAAKGMQDAIAIRPLAAFNSQMAISAQRAQILTNMFKQGTTQLINFGKNVQWAGRQLMVGFTVPLTIFGVTAGKIFRDLEKEVVNFRKVYGGIFTTDVEVEKSLENVKELAAEFTKYGIAVKDTLELAAIGAQAGKTGNELLAATTQATRLAVLGDLDKQQAMRTSIALQSAFRLSNEELANSINFLNMVENSSVLSLKDLAEAIPRVAPVIVGLGGNVQDMAVFLTAMREGGVSAAEAANGLKSSLGRLISPTKQAKDMANSFNISLEKIVELNEGDVLGMVISLSNAMKQLTDLQKQQLLSAVFGKFQFARMGALFENITREGSNAQNVIKLMDMSIEDVAETAEKELGAIEASVGTQMVAAMERLKLAIAPIGELFVQLAIPVINFFTQLIEKFNNLPDFQKRFIAMASVIVGLVIPAGTMFIGLLMNLSGTLAKIMQGIGLFVKGLVTQGGIVGAIKAVTQSTKYMSLEEIDAAIAARQLGSATNAVNTALRNQVVASQGARAAVADLATTYSVLISRMSQAAALAPVTLGAAGAAMKGSAASKIKPVSPKQFAQGGVVPGSGNQDTVPAMLMPGEFVVKKSAVGSVGRSFLEKLNNGFVPGMMKGGEMYERQTAMAQEVPALDRLNSGTATNVANVPTQTTRPLNTLGMDFTKIPQKELESSFSNRLLNAYAKHSPQNLQLLGGNTVLLPGEINNAMKMNRGTGLNQIQRKELANYLRSSGVNALAPLIEASKSSGIKLSNREIKSIVNNIANKVESNTSQKMFDRDFSKIVNSELAKNPKLVPIAKQLRTSQSSFRVTGSTQEIINTLNKESPGRYSLSKEIAKDGRPRIYDSKLKRSYTYKSNDTRDISRRLQQSLRPEQNPVKSYQALRKSPSVKLAMAAISKRTGAKNLQLSHFNQGGMVPSLLTPGEFVVNREMAAQNRPFLEALNSGKVRRFQNAGSVENLPLGTRGGNQTAQMDARRSAAQKRLAGIKSAPISSLGGAAGAAAFPALIAGPLMQQSSNEVTKKFGDIVTASVPVLFGLQILAPALKSIAMKFPLMLGPVGGIIAGFAALTGVALIAAKQIKQVEESGAKLASAMSGSSEQVNRFASELGQRTIRQERIIAAASATAEGVTPELQSAAQQFVESKAGQELLKDIQMVQKAGGDTVEALRNQLNRAILAGVLTPEDAKAIAIEVGAALDDEQLAIKSTAQIISIIGPDGEFLADNVLKIQAQLQTSLDPDSIRASAEAAYEESATGWMRFRDRIFGDGAKEATIGNIEITQTEQEVANSISATSDAIEQLKFAYQEGKIGVKEFKDETAKLREEAGQTVTKGLKVLGVSLEDIQKKSGSRSLFDLRGTEQWLTATEKGAVRMLKKVQKDAKDVFVKAGLKDEIPNLMKVITEDLAEGDAEGAAEIFAQIVSGDITPSVLNSLLEAIDDDDLKAKLRALFNVQVNITTSGGAPSAIFDPGDFEPDPDPDPSGAKQKSRIEQIRESAKATKDYANAVKQLANEKNKEAIASIGTSFAELKGNAQRKEAIKLIQQQLSLQKLVDFALQGKKEQQIAALNMSNRVIETEISGIQRQIEGTRRLNELDQRRINQIQRLNEMDQRQIELRNRALDQIAKKEKDVNKLYDEKISALDRVAKSNDRLAQQEKQRADLASALTSGDIAAAAAAANAMTQSFTQSQIDDTRANLDLQRQREIDALTASVNGQLLTREQIELQLDDINERIYQRNLNIRDIQDQIYLRELSIIPLEDQIYQLNLQRESTLDRINILQLEIEKAEYQKMLQADKTNKVLGAQRGILRGIINDLNEAIRKSDYLMGQRGRAEGAFGGNVSIGRIGMAMGGRVNYKGSNESPPALMMGGGKVKKYAVGSIVPGLGNTDRVPALLTPGEFVVRKSVAKQNMGLLKALNSDIFPSLGKGDMSADSSVVQATSSSINNMPVYNSYSVNVNVPNTNASPEEIANVVISRLQRSSMSTIRTTRR